MCPTDQFSALGGFCTMNMPSQFHATELSDIQTGGVRAMYMNDIGAVTLS